MFYQDKAVLQVNLAGGEQQHPARVSDTSETLFSHVAHEISAAFDIVIAGSAMEEGGPRAFFGTSTCVEWRVIFKASNG